MATQNYVKTLYQISSTTHYVKTNLELELFKLSFFNGLDIFEYRYLTLYILTIIIKDLYSRKSANEEKKDNYFKKLKERQTVIKGINDRFSTSRVPSIYPSNEYMSPAIIENATFFELNSYLKIYKGQLLANYNDIKANYNDVYRRIIKIENGINDFIDIGDEYYLSYDFSTINVNTSIGSNSIYYSFDMRYFLIENFDRSLNKGSNTNHALITPIVQNNLKLIRSKILIPIVDYINAQPNKNFNSFPITILNALYSEDMTSSHRYRKLMRNGFAIELMVYNISVTQLIRDIADNKIPGLEYGILTESTYKNSIIITIPYHIDEFLIKKHIFSLQSGMETLL